MIEVYLNSRGMLYQQQTRVSESHTHAHARTHRTDAVSRRLSSLLCVCAQPSSLGCSFLPSSRVFHRQVVGNSVSHADSLIYQSRWNRFKFSEQAV